LGILRSIESRLERVVEGSVGRLFRASVAPVELARKLAKELEEGKVVSVTQTYAPNEYTIYLSPRDRTRFADFEASLRNELASYLAEHARRAGYVMPTRPRVRFETESSLHTGIFGISTALVRDDDAPLEPPASVPPATAPPEPVLEGPSAPPAAPEEPVRSPLDPDPSEAVPPGGFPAFPLEPEPEPEPEPSPAPFVPPPPDVASLPDVPLPESMPTPPIPPVPSVPSPPAPPATLPALPSFPDPAQRPPETPEPPPATPPPVPETPPPPVPAAFEPPLDATMITPREPREELVLVHDNERTPIEGAVLQIGRAPGCDIVLDDRNVSRRHAEIRRRGPVVVLIDLDSTNGTIVNGRRVREHPLADGDRITLGNSRLTFERRTT
jgi:hypothetical protein